MTNDVVAPSSSPPLQLFYGVHARRGGKAVPAPPPADVCFWQTRTRSSNKHFTIPVKFLTGLRRGNGVKEEQGSTFTCLSALRLMSGSGRNKRFVRQKWNLPFCGCRSAPVCATEISIWMAPSSLHPLLLRLSLHRRNCGWLSSSSTLLPFGGRRLVHIRRNQEVCSAVWRFSDWNQKLSSVDSPSLCWKRSGWKQN